MPFYLCLPKEYKEVLGKKISWCGATGRLWLSVTKLKTTNMLKHFETHFLYLEDLLDKILPSYFTLLPPQKQPSQWCHTVPRTSQMKTAERDAGVTSVSAIVTVNAHLQEIIRLSIKVKIIQPRVVFRKKLFCFYCVAGFLWTCCLSNPTLKLHDTYANKVA